MAQRKVNEICQDENQQSKGLLNETVKTKKKNHKLQKDGILIKRKRIQLQVAVKATMTL